MDHMEVGRMWDENADVWTGLSRAGHDVFRDLVNTPAFLAMLPDISGLSGLDIGCGEGHNTRLLARRGAKMAALDISKTFVRHAHQAEKGEPLGIRYVHASAVDPPFPDRTFDFATAFMSLMDAPEHERLVREAYRILRPGGFLQFSIIHPCFQTPRWKWVCDEEGRRVAIECGDYFDPPDNEIEEWMFSDAPPEMQHKKFRIPVFRRTLSSWMNLLLNAGFALERFDEPYADESTAQKVPQLACTRVIAFFLIIRCRKPQEEVPSG